MENNDYFTEKIAPKKNNANPKQSGKVGERSEKPRRKEFRRNPKSESAGASPIDLALTEDDSSPEVESIGVSSKSITAMKAKIPAPFIFFQTEGF